MLKAPADFPYPGSEALLGDKRVRIIGELADGRRLISAKGITRTVEVDQLSDASLPDQPMDRWYAERVIRIGRRDAARPRPPISIATSTGFSRARTVDDNRMPTRHAFAPLPRAQGPCDAPSARSTPQPPLRRPAAAADAGGGVMDAPRHNQRSNAAPSGASRAASTRSPSDRRRRFRAS
jgi:hypothetical protein